MRCRVLGFLDSAFFDDVRREKEHYDGPAAALVDRAVELARGGELEIVQAWTRDDAWVHAWYEACGFRKRYSYLHVYLSGQEVRDEVTIRTEGLKPILAFAQYTGGAPVEDELRRRFARTHDDVLFERTL